MGDRGLSARGPRPRAADGPLLVFYDGDCGLCTGLVAWALGRDRHRALRALDARSDEAHARTGADPARLLEELHVWSEHDGTRRGVEAVAALLARLPGWGWLGALAGARLLRPFASRLYRLVAGNRAWFGAARCPLPDRGGS